MTDTPEHAASVRFSHLENGLDAITDRASSSHKEEPKAHLHAPANEEHSHSWMKRLFPYGNLEEMENAFHMGNYVIDRRTGEKTFESMSMYVRMGMHLLYYGSEQERLLEWSKTKQLLKDQSEKMGKEYDDPKSVDHIKPFIEVSLHRKQARLPRNEFEFSQQNRSLTALTELRPARNTQSVETT